MAAQDHNSTDKPIHTYQVVPRNDKGDNNDNDHDSDSPTASDNPCRRVTSDNDSENDIPLSQLRSQINVDVVDWIFSRLRGSFHEPVVL